MTNAQNDGAAQLDSAPARFLDQSEGLRMGLSNELVIRAAIEVNHAGIGKEPTLERYRDHLVHFNHYLASVHGATFYTAKRQNAEIKRAKQCLRKWKANQKAAAKKTRGGPSGQRRS